MHYAGRGTRQAKGSGVPVGVEPPQRIVGPEWHGAIAVGLLLLCLLAYANSFKSGWVLDNLYIIKYDPRTKATSWEDQVTAAGTNQAGVKQIFLQDYWWPKGISGLYRPITSFTYWLNWTVIGKYGNNPPENPVGFHWVNLALHWGNALLVYFLTLRLTQRFWVAALTAGIFATHPIATESVTNIIGRADLLAAMSVLVGTLLYIRAADTPGWRKIPWLITIMLVYALGVFCKESAFVLPAVLICYDFTYRWFRHADWEARIGTILYSLLNYLVLLPPLVAFFWVRYWIFFNSTPPEEPFLDNPIRHPALRFFFPGHQTFNEWVLGRLTAIKVAGKLLWLMVWPVTLSSDYSYNEVPLVNWHMGQWQNFESLVALLALLVILGVAIWNFRHNKAVFFFISLYFINYTPTSNFILNIGSIMAERFMYLPLIAFSAVLVISVDALLRKYLHHPMDDPNEVRTRHAPASVRWPQLVLSVLILLYAVRAFVRNYDWKSDVTLWTAAKRVSPMSFRSYQSYSFAIFEQYKLPPEQRLPEVRNMSDQEMVDAMIKSDETGLKIVDSLPDQLNSSRLYLHLGMYYWEQAMRVMSKAPNGDFQMNDAARPWVQKSAAILERGTTIDRAFNEINRQKDVLRGKAKSPDQVADVGLPPLYTLLGPMYARLGRYDEAVQTLRYAQQLDPNDADTHAKLAGILLEQGKAEEGCVQLMQTILFDPKRGDAWQTLANVFAASNNGGDPNPPILQDNGRLRLSLENRLVRECLCSAYRDMTRLYLRSKRPDYATEERNVAVNNYHFPVTLFDPLFVENLPPYAPATPVFYKKPTTNP
jgi:tetratricopeptide (TPR) repeat protein